ncbi:endonuclease/exonuclease/phosphatase family protein [Streptomyces paludis]|uniref:endonuclease/exonuclease/phosphatase family protein n=1 Tax=Streptomyces paludis TaxID=2282738 RepID=UPI001E459F55|nr:endonuclease/exonuclease/phosphatase family protein [Streptomyces paludis]
MNVPRLPTIQPGVRPDVQTEDRPTSRPPHRRLLAAATGLFLVGATLLTGCRLLGTDAVTPVPQLLAFLPWLLVPLTLAALATALLRWRTGMVWALVVLAATGWSVRTYDTDGDRSGDYAAAAHTGPAPDGPASTRLRVLTSNVEFGQGTLGLIDTIRREKPDLVFVQECEFVCARLLADRIPATDYPYRNVVTADRAAGSAILSVFPLTPAAGVKGTLAMPGSTARIGGRTVHLQLAHPLPPIPGMVDDWRRELGHLRTYAAATREDGAPVIVAGDFNATRDHAAFRALLKSGGLRTSALVAGAGRTPSWPAGVPRPLGAQIDHVLVSEDFSVRSARFIDLADTDHRSLLVTLDLPAADTDREPADAKREPADAEGPDAEPADAERPDSEPTEVQAR